MKTLKMTLAEARRLVLFSQGLAAPIGNGQDSARKTIEHLGYVQLDTISVVERAHHHVIWSRVAGYTPAVLRKLIETEKSAFEYWAHAAAILPMRDFRFSLPMKSAYQDGKKMRARDSAENRKIRRMILSRLKQEGPLSSRDLGTERKRKSQGWFDRTPEKRMLEQLFFEGRIMTSGRRGFQRVYDLTENVLPSHVETRFPLPREMARHLILSFLRAHGLARASEITYLRPAFRKDVETECERLEAEGVLRKIRVEGIESPFLTVSELPDFAQLETDTKVKIISPFDNLVIRRKRLKEIFHFDYMIECYLPVAKRKFGYFSLPLLRENRFVGRLDAKADRQSKVLLIRSVHGESRGSIDEAELIAALNAFAAFNGCKKVKWNRRVISHSPASQ